jgi:hypothetical protein
VDQVFASPEEAALEGDRDVRVVAVEYSPDGSRAIVFLEYNPGSNPRPYEVLCERFNDGWTSSVGSSGGAPGFAWKFTHEMPSGELGVLTRWDPPRAEWDTPPPPSPASPADAEPW